MKLQIEQILLEDARFAHAPDFLARQTKENVPSLDVELRLDVMKAPDGSGAVVRLRATSESAGSHYSFGVSYLVLFRLLRDENEALPSDLDKRLLVTGANMAFPFLRECVANITMRGRFGPSWLAPADFSSLVSDAAATQTVGASAP